jgi:phosphoglycolate phosphatase
MNRALADFGCPPLAQAAYPPLLGWGLEALAQKALPPDRARDAAALAQTMAAYYAAAPLVQTTAYPQVAPILDALRLKRFKLAVFTNKKEEIARQIVTALFPLCFDEIRGGRPGVPGKPDPSAVWEILASLDITPSQTVFAGDSDIDIATAKNALCFPLGVTWGYRPLSVLLDAGAAATVSTAEEFLELVSAR